MPAPTFNLERTRLLEEALELSRVLQSASQKVPDSLTQRRQARLRSIGLRLKDFAHPIDRDRLTPNEIPLQVRDGFVKAVLLLTRYQKLGNYRVSGTLTSPTLSQYRPDTVPETWQGEDATMRLCQQFELSVEYQRELNAMLEQVDSSIERHRRIIQAIAAEANGASTKADGLQLFQQLFGNLPIPSSAIDCLVTEMQVCFAIDYQDGKLRDASAWNSLSESDRDTISGFLEELDQFSFKQFGCFPTFSHLESHQIDRALCLRLEARTGFNRVEIIQTIMHSIGVVPTHKAEAFLIHDIWGHFWQLLLTQFAGDYAILTSCGQPLRLGETAYTPDGPLSIGELFVMEGSVVQLDVSRARLFFHAEVQQRLGLLFTHLISEMLADVAEFKWVWNHTQLDDLLPSSSLFKSEPTKLDLSLKDVDFLFLRVLQPLLEVKLSVLSDSELETDLLASLVNITQLNNGDVIATRATIKQAIMQLYQVFLEEYRQHYLPTLSSDGLFSRLLSNLLALQNVVNQLYTSTSVYSDFPFQDLLVLFIGSYCSADCYKDFWNVDDVLASYFFPCWHLVQGGGNKRPQDDLK